MKVLVIGANGKVGQRIVNKLLARNHRVLAMVRNEDQREKFEKKGAKVVIADLENNLGHAFTDRPDAVIFTAGSGSQTGKDKTMAVDLQGAKKSVDEARKHHVDRYLMVSAFGSEKPDKAPAGIRHYFVAKGEADQHLIHSDLFYTIFRPTRLTDNPGTGSVEAASELDNHEVSTSRDNLATAVVDALTMRNTHKKIIEITDGNTPVKDALGRI